MGFFNRKKQDEPKQNKSLKEIPFERVLTAEGWKRREAKEAAEKRAR